MSIAGFPTSSDIYLEADGVRVAGVQSYCAKTTVAGQAVHVIELSRLYATDEAMQDKIDFHTLSGFSLVICKPDRKIIYTDCQWSAIQESAEIGSMVLEKVTLVASRRIETGV